MPVRQHRDALLSWLDAMSERAASNAFSSRRCPSYAMSEIGGLPMK